MALKRAIAHMCVGAVTVVLVFVLGGCFRGDVQPAPAVTVTVTETVTSQPAAGGTSDSSTATPVTKVVPVAPYSDLPTVAFAQLPVEAQDILVRIDNGGPFDYDEDDETFQNREGILPSEPVGFYREYTVATPGSDDRGARRIVAGQNGARYYTDDHYQSFEEVIQ